MSWIERIRFPHVFTLLTFIVFLASLSTWIIPSGRYAREVLGTARLAALGARDGEAWQAPSGFKISADRNPNRAGLEAVLGLAPDPEAAAALAGDIEAGKVKVLVVIGGIPGGGYPDELTVVAGKLDFLAVLDVVHSDLIEKAHLVLPGATYAEKNGTFVNEDGRVQRLRPALTPPFLIILRTLSASSLVFGPTGMTYALILPTGMSTPSFSKARIRRSKPKANPVEFTSSPPKSSARLYAPPPQICFSAPNDGESISNTMPV